MSSPYQQQETQLRQYEPIPDKIIVSHEPRCLCRRNILCCLVATVIAIAFCTIPESSNHDLPIFHKALLELNQSIAGTVVVRSTDNDRLEQVSRVWVRHAGLPYAVVLVATEDDVAQSVCTFRQHEIPFRIRSGGHHKLGYSTLKDGVVLDLQQLNQIEWITPDTLQVGPATTVHELYNFIRPFNVSSVMGFCGSVGEAGFVLGGGFGILSRSYGLGLDNALDFRIVLADGSATTPEGDLDWALRGAGGGSFGVVTSMSYKVHPISQVLQVMSVHIPVTTDRADFLYKVGALDHPGNMVMMHDTIATVNMLWWGESDHTACQGKAYFASLLEGANHFTNVTYEFYNMTWDDMYGVSTASEVPDWGSSVYAASCWCGFLMPQNNTKTVWREILRLFDEHVDQHLVPDIELWGGAISHRNRNATAFPYREAVYNVGVLLLIQEEDDDLYESKVESVNRWWPKVAKYLQGTYVNYPMKNASPSLMWGEHLPRLMDTKRHYDPDNFFHHPLGVPS